MSVTLDPALAATSDPADVKTCDRDGCGRTFYRVKKFNKTAFARQRFCGHGCSLQGMRRPKTRKTTKPKTKPVVVAKPKPVVVVPERPPWRPPGFAPQPTIRRTA